MSALEDRLAHLDLRFDLVGDHLDADALASISQGRDPSSAEAQHLAGCDGCTDLLVATGVGMEAALDEVPGAEQWVNPPATASTGGGSAGLLLGGGALVVSAVALWVALGGQEPVAPNPPPAAVAEAVSPTISSLSHVAPLSQPSGSSQNEPTPQGSRSPAPSAAPASIAPAERPARRRPRVARPPAMPDASMRARGPKTFEGRPVDGPPRGAGYLRLNTKPPAKVYIDGKLVGWTPLLDHRMLEGPHDVRLVYESPRARLSEERFRVVIEPDRIWRSLRRNLKR